VDGGAGLGLALVRAIVLRHQGSVRCEERAGGGSSFVVTLPREKSLTMPT
jgi:two-component system OmpR family sensor kinase